MSHHRLRNAVLTALMTLECVSLLGALYYSAFYLWLSATPQDSPRVRTLFYSFAFASLAAFIALCMTIAYRIRCAARDRLNATGRRKG